MFIEWNDGINPYVDFRGSIKQFHDRLTAPGTNVTHLTEKEGQFDFDTEVLQDPISFNTSFSQTSKPLYYKFTCVGKKAVYITFAFIKVSYNTSYQQTILGIIRVSEFFKEYKGYNTSDTIIPVSRNTNTYETYITNSYNYVQISSNTNLVGGTYGYIYTDDINGILSFGSSLGLYLPGQSMYKKYPLLWAMIRTTPTGVMFTRPIHMGNLTHHTTVPYTDPGTGVISVAINSVGIAQQHNLRDLTVNDVELSAIMEYYYINDSGNLEVLPGVFVYNFKRHVETGINIIGDRTFYFLGDGISTFNIGLHDNLSFAFEVTNA